jgi:hypothetical protein
MTGFSFSIEDYDATHHVSAQLLTGGAFAADDDGAAAETLLKHAVLDMEAAYLDARGRTNTDASRINLGAGILGGVFGGKDELLTPGVVYSFTTGLYISADFIYLLHWHCRRHLH